MCNTYQSPIGLRYEFPQLHNPKSKWLLCLRGSDFDFYFLLYSKLPHFVKEVILQQLSAQLFATWLLILLSSACSCLPQYFTSCLWSVWITAQVTVTALQQEWEGRKRVNVQLTAQKNNGVSGTPWMNSLGGGCFPNSVLQSYMRAWLWDGWDLSLEAMPRLSMDIGS